VNADDFGLSAGVNRGILEAHAAGVVSSVSVLVNLPAWEDALRGLRGAGPGLGVGLHVNLTAGSPLSGGGTLRDPRTGAFHPLEALVRRALAGRVDPADVAAECAAQVARLREAGVAITHLDGHRHVHVLPGVWPAVVETARRQGIAVVRVPLEPLGANPGNWRALVKKVALAAAWRTASRGAPAPRSADRFFGVSLQGGREFLPRLMALLDRLEQGTTELMVHPGHADGDLAQPVGDRYVTPRAAELAVLTSPVVRERFRRGDFRLIHFGAL
jgi:predicted glycoside hydrolase/deacetylase ChbG (UPF0249 family)